MRAGDIDLNEVETSGQLMEGLIDAITSTSDSVGQAFGLELVALVRKYLPDSTQITGYKAAIAALVTEATAGLVGYVESQQPKADPAQGN